MTISRSYSLPQYIPWALEGEEDPTGYPQRRENTRSNGTHSSRYHGGCRAVGH